MKIYKMLCCNVIVLRFSRIRAIEDMNRDPSPPAIPFYSETEVCVVIIRRIKPQIASSHIHCSCRPILHIVLYNDRI